jgi:hypothetical protein
MSDSPVKQRLDRAMRAAVDSLKCCPQKYQVSILNNHVFHIEALRMKEIIRVRVVLDKATEHDITIVRNISLPPIFTKEIWVRHRNSKGFEVIEF